VHTDITRNSHRSHRSPEPALPEYRPDEAVLRELRRFARIGWATAVVSLPSLAYQAWLVIQAFGFWTKQQTKMHVQIMLYCVLMLATLVTIIALMLLSYRLQRYAGQAFDYNLYRPVKLLRNWGICILAGAILNLAFYIWVFASNPPYIF
jgi:ABC-type glycerol-3-phosphate transport system permease component